MGDFIKLLQGKKTHILVAIYCLLVLIGGGEGPRGFEITNIGTGDLQAIVLGMMASTAKAAWDRWIQK